MDKKTFILKIFRGSPGKQYWEEFELERKPYYNIITYLLQIQRNPINKEGQVTTPIVWESGCLEEVCGSCSILINGKPRQSCTALVEKIIEKTGDTTITLAPLTKFPLVRDLIVDRSVMFDNLKRVHAWIDLDTTKDRGFGPKIDPKKQDIMYSIARCMTCGCCSEACPQVNDNSDFMGPAPIAQVRFFNAYPHNGRNEERLHALMQEGGISGCGNAQNCVRVCPKEVPLTDSIAAMYREVTVQAFKDLFSFPDLES
jgi:succinate dehydrogenase / fumarate reductase iron-sulfur subunit